MTTPPTDTPTSLFAEHCPRARCRRVGACRGAFESCAGHAAFRAALLDRMWAAGLAVLDGIDRGRTRRR